VIGAITLGLAALLLCGAIHYLVMHTLNAWLSTSRLAHALQVQLTLLTLSGAHLLEAGVYAIAFWGGERLGLGGFIQEDPINAMSTYYFSLVNFTSLGLGDIHPSGHLRFIAGLESLSGFLLISCSAALLFLAATNTTAKEASHAA
jgi:hypothetical protein